ncbi:MAG TPA: nucleotidyl transferase AbiEii/AbiGii toxin family protein [Kiritimatiellia bacterium]|nr:nucleotidyl transferase AbiEii/AbiGii toxin family protein [Kiritimatiellia bacterium]
MKRAMQLKARMKQVAREKGISAQLALQNYMLERLLERISLSAYRRNFVLKGGLLISAMAGLAARTTMDMDGTIRRVPATPESLVRMFRKICAVPVEDGVSFVVKRAEEIRESDEYSGVRLALEAKCPPMAVPLKVDVTAGDKITPREIAYDYPLRVDGRTIRILAYNVETILAEKLETILSRGDLNTRMRDFYDVHLLQSLLNRKIEREVLGKALTATMRRRGTLPLLKQHEEIMRTIAASPAMAAHWQNYRRDYSYARGMEFAEACRAIAWLLRRIVPAKSR